MRADMKAHLDQTLAEAVDELSGNFAASVAEYEIVHAHILAMADMLSNGIIGQFPRHSGEHRRWPLDVIAPARARRYHRHRRRAARVWTCTRSGRRGSNGMLRTS
jgi:hypothetical protein